MGGNSIEHTKNGRWHVVAGFKHSLFKDTLEPLTEQSNEYKSNH